MRIRKKALVTVGLLAAMGLHVSAPSARAAQCMNAGGYGTGAFEGFAAFMAEAAMKNSAKARLGEPVKFSPVHKKCAQTGLLVECHARARACR
jgi:hypothetical protein